MVHYSQEPHLCPWCKAGDFKPVPNEQKIVQGIVYQIWKCDNLTCKYTTMAREHVLQQH